MFLVMLECRNSSSNNLIFIKIQKIVYIRYSCPKCLNNMHKPSWSFMNITLLENKFWIIGDFLFSIKRENIQGMGRFGRRLDIQMWKSSSSIQNIYISEFSVSSNPHLNPVIIVQYKNKRKTPVLVNTALLVNYIINTEAFLRRNGREERNEYTSTKILLCVT